MVKGIIEFLCMMREGYQIFWSDSIYWLQEAHQDKKSYHLGKLQMETGRRERCPMVVFGGSCWSSIMVNIVLRYDG